MHANCQATPFPCNYRTASQGSYLWRDEIHCWAIRQHLPSIDCNKSAGELKTKEIYSYWRFVTSGPNPLVTTFYIRLSLSHSIFQSFYSLHSEVRFVKWCDNIIARPINIAILHHNVILRFLNWNHMYDDLQLLDAHSYTLCSDPKRNDYETFWRFLLNEGTSWTKPVNQRRPPSLLPYLKISH
jgi:hypothetical protein